jgi:hypothetical protein
LYPFKARARSQIKLHNKICWMWWDNGRTLKILLTCKFKFASKMLQIIFFIKNFM